VNAPLADFTSARNDPAVHGAYYAPLLDELARLGVGYGARPARIEVVATRDHWEARYVAVRVPIARGWERQLDNRRNALFYDGRLTAGGYGTWLRDQAISYVALPDAPLDYSARAEATLVRSRPSYLTQVWRSAHWRLFAVVGATPLAEPPGLLTQLGSASFTLLAPRPGAYEVRLRFTPYWRVTRGRGCVGRAAGDWTSLRARAAGPLHVVISFSLARVFEHGPRCG
jgi:hypothetical protein